MAKFLKYEGSFLTIPGRTCTVRIYQEAVTVFPSVGVLNFPAERPLQIEWQEAPIEQPVCGSNATLTVISETDRDFIDLYTVSPGSIRMDVLLDSVFYWSGLLDPEFYSEPYETEDGYDVSFTFTDFGILDRLKFTGTGVDSVRNILRDAVAAAGINVTALDESLISSYIGNSRATLDQINIIGQNFYDEEGEASTLREVLDGILQPLSLKLVQKAGKLWIYDINALASASSDSTTDFISGGVLGVEKVYNNARIVFSQYADGGGITNGIECEGDFSGHKTVATANFTNSGDFFSYLISKRQVDGAIIPIEDAELGFNIYPVTTASGDIASVHSSTKFFHIQSITDGKDAEGVIHWFKTGGYLSSNPSGSRKMNSSIIADGNVLFTTKKFYIPPYPVVGRQPDYLLRIIIPLLLDSRVNPFEESAEGSDEAEIKEALERDVRLIFVPVQIRLYDANGNVVKHYANDRGSSSSPTGTVTMRGSLGIWEDGDYSTDTSTFWWYNADYSCPLFGWKNNRQKMIGSGVPLASIERADDGQYIPYPAGGGYLEIKVMTDLAVGIRSGVPELRKDKLRWALYKSPEISVVENDAALSEIENEDIEYSGTLLADAKEELTINTVCGSFANGAVPTAKGIFYDTSMAGISEMTRAGRTKEMDQLLIGTLYSHYGSRHIRLSGTTEAHCETLRWFEDPASPGVKLMLLSQVQDIRAGEDEVVFAEINNDEYVADDE